MCVCVMCARFHVVYVRGYVIYVCWYLLCVTPSACVTVSVHVKRFARTCTCNSGRLYTRTDIISYIKCLLFNQIAI